MIRAMIASTIMSSVVPRPTKVKKFAILLSYCGAGYFGLQRNKDVRTIEGDLFDALIKAGLITQDQADRPQAMYFQRAARTDKGVSALKQILSCRLPQDFPEKVELINSYLPQQIRLIAAKRVTRFFDCKNYCDYRTYAYIMPTYALCRPDETASPEFRVQREHITVFNETLSKYLGTHNYHNFTSQRLATDPSSQRYIMSIECGDPFVRKNLEFVIIRVRGQSFMLHQIRKMIGLAIGIQRGFATQESIGKAFDLERLDIPIAPGLGLMLEEVHYDRYNQRYSGDGYHEAIHWEEYNDTIRKFADEYIYSYIIDQEVSALSMIKWLQLLPVHSFDVRQPGPPTPLNEVSTDLLNSFDSPASEANHEEGDRSRTEYGTICHKIGLIGSKRHSEEDEKPKADSEGPANQAEKTRTEANEELAKS